MSSGPHIATPTIVVVDDEPSIRELLVAGLRFSGFTVSEAGTGNSALALIMETQPDLVVLDVMLPDQDGFTVARTLRNRGIEVPIIFLTAKDEVSDRVRGLSVGGDDYLTKPFSLEELVARIKAVLRRVGTKSNFSSDNAEVLIVGDLSLNLATYEVYRGGILVELSPTELKLLEYLMENAGRVVSKEQILDRVWQQSWAGDVNVVESYISYLRRKLDQAAPEGTTTPLPTLIHTKRGLGYLLKLALKS